MMRRITIVPTLHEVRKNRRLTRADYDELVEDDALGTLPDGTVKFLYLRSAIPRRTTNSMFRQLNTLPFNPARNSRRAAVRAETGGELAFGCVDYKPGGPKWLAPTLQLPLPYQFALVPLLNALANLMAERLPAKWQTQVDAARKNGRMIVGNEWLNPDGISFMRPHLLDARKCSLLPPLFTTIQINRNIRTRLHRDAGNLSGLACLTAFGSWEGAELVFPRFAVAFPLRPGDVLMADTGAELHGNVPPLMGTRISVVAFLRPMQRCSLV
jgi:hypothetical protein